MPLPDLRNHWYPREDRSLSRRRKQRAQESAPKDPPPREPFWNRRRAIIAATLAVALSIGGGLFADWWSCLPDDAHATYVGRQTCAECHQQETELWKGSHHDLAMDHASDSTVLGDFDDAEVTHHDVTSRMFRDGRKYMVHTEGPDGEMGDFEVKFVLGVTPLQQYMVEFNRDKNAGAKEVGQLQVLRLSWDTQQKRWFYLAPPDVPEKLAPTDDLHWTGIAQRWNSMCADCHTTNLQKNFDDKTGHYRTTFSEIDVSCETCHGPGSLHVELAENRRVFWDRKRGYGLAKLKSVDSTVEIESCAPCHSRRRLVHPNFAGGDDYHNHFAAELLQSHTYHADGQIMDEVYVYGSFIQSKMFHKGIRCTDCHDPHTARLKHQGNKLCTSCHQHNPAKYDTPAHHNHKIGSPGAQCVECHMPETTYMAVDPRRDHSLRIPRPDLSVDLQTPNACTRCHVDDERPAGDKYKPLKLYPDWLLAARDDEDVRTWVHGRDKWSADHVAKWFPNTRRPEHFAIALSAGRERSDEAQDELADLAVRKTMAPIVRATALAELAMHAPLSDGNLKKVLRAVKDANPEVRSAAVAQLQGLPPRELIEHAVPLLEDPVRMVRTEAARVLAFAPRIEMTGPQRRLHDQALDEFREGMMLNNDRAAAHLTMGILYENLGENSRAEAAYTRAIQVEPSVTGPRTNLAAMYERELRPLEREMQQLTIQRQKEQALKLAQQAAEKKAKLDRLRAEELQLLARDAGLAPDNAPIQYRYGLSLYLHHRYPDAVRALKRAYELEPKQPDFVLGLALLYQKLGRIPEAIKLAKELVELRPDEPSPAALLEALTSPK
jgi:predicted CXXCH cytochrome family protein